LKARKSFVHLAADAEQKSEGYQQYSIHAVGFY
jgi:hypothetical protein